MTAKRRPGSRAELVRRLSGFSLLPFLSFVSPFLVLPVASAHASTAQWAGLAVGQSIGSLAATVAQFGWGVTGSVRAARASSSDWRDLYSLSVASKVTVLIPTSMVAMLLAYLTAPADAALLTMSTAGVMTLNAFSISWFAVGMGRPGLIARYDLLPRMSALLLGAAAMVIWGDIAFYVLALAAGPILSVLMFSRHLALDLSLVSLSRVIRDLHDQAAAALTSVISSVYTASTLFLVGLVATTSQIAALSSADRVFRFSLFAIVAITTGLQAWVVSPSPATARRRQRQALLTHLSVGVCGGLGLSLAGPSVVALLFSDQPTAGNGIFLFYGVTFTSIAVRSTLSQHVLIPDGRTRAVLLSTLAGALVGVPLILYFTAVYGIQGAAVALAASDLCVVACLAWTSLARQGRGRRSSEETPAA